MRIQTSASSDKVQIDFSMGYFFSHTFHSPSPLYQYQAQKRQESRFVGFVNGTLESVPS